MKTANSAKKPNKITADKSRNGFLKIPLGVVSVLFSSLNTLKCLLFAKAMLFLRK